MKKDKISLFFFIDAFGWEILKRHPSFLKRLGTHRKELKTILGYSSGCDPSIISGKVPSEHLHWSGFYYSPATSPFKVSSWLKYFPNFLMQNHRVRHYISKMIKNTQGFTGYFQVYQIPFGVLPYFDYAEKKRIWTSGGLLRGKTIFDHLNVKGIPHYVGDQDSEDKQFTEVMNQIKNRSIQMAYLLFGKMDAAMHAHGTHDPKVRYLVEHYNRVVSTVIEEAKKVYSEVDFYVFSDHGMHNVTETIDLQKKITEIGLIYGKDYIAIYDSTMARFWYLNERAEKLIKECLGNVKEGRILSDRELEELGVFFPDAMYGQTIFLLNSNILIIPSFMGAKQIPGMHGYHPDDPDSSAMIISNREDIHSIDRIEQIYKFLSEVGKG